ncbi:MAG: ankyrin repeat domain-containing protein, partial [Zoogloea sp.]|nr:ankyrin repeat domain-containing protein [Zoogloea sp.]
MRQRLLPACLAGLLLLAPLESTFAAAPALTIEDRSLATRAALDALFSMEALVPEGAAPTPPPGFTDDADEAALIAFLARQKRRGASLDAYRQLGTPLHHTIRAGMHATARWLLANGADPRLRVRDTAEAPTGFPPPDALGVAVAAGAWKLVDTLLHLPAYAALSPQEKARAIWPYALASASRTAGL